LGRWEGDIEALGGACRVEAAWRKRKLTSHRIECADRWVRNFHPLSNVLKPELRGASQVEHRKGAELNITFVVKALNRPEKADRGILPAVGMKA
jgi:hypothetical protein